METYDSPLAGLKRCPFCYQLPVFDIRGAFLRGGCPEHLPDVVMQPADMPAEAVKQWNNAIEPIIETLRIQAATKADMEDASSEELEAAAEILDCRNSNGGNNQ